MNIELLEERLADLPLYGYFFIDPKALEFSDRIRHICQAECPMYNKTWACPPAVGSVESCEGKCKSYVNCLIIGTAVEVADIADALVDFVEHRSEADYREGILQEKAKYAWSNMTAALLEVAEKIG